MLQAIGLISYRMEHEQEEEQGEEFDELFEFDQEEMNQFQSESRKYYQQPREENQEDLEANKNQEMSKNVRHLFLKLAEKFHPDKITDAETQTRHTEIRKELNRAYQEGDLLPSRSMIAYTIRVVNTVK